MELDIKFGVEIELEFAQVVELQGEEFLVPAGVLGQLVVGQDVGTPLQFGHVGQPDNRHRLEPQEFGRRDPAVAGQDSALIVDQHRVGEAKLLDAPGDLADLPVGVLARIARAGL